MIRGVNKQVIEVREIENPYFERALLFVKKPPESGQQRDYEFYARQCVRKLTAGYRRVPGRRVWVTVAKYLVTAAAGAGLALLFFG